MATNFGKLNFSTSFKPTAAFPLDSRCYFESFTEAQNAAQLAEEAGSSKTIYYFGQTLVVSEGGKAKLYIIQPDKTLKEAGSGALTATNYTAAKLLAQADNKGTIVYVENDELVSGDTFTKGPYIVTGVNTLLKLGTTTASGDLASDVGNLKTDVNTLKSTVGDNSKGLVKDVADVKTSIGTLTTELDKKYEKPVDGIDKADLSREVKTLLGSAGSAIQTLTIAGKTLNQTTNSLSAEEIKSALGLKDAAYVTVDSLNTTAQGYANKALEDSKQFTLDKIAALKTAQMVVVAEKPATGQEQGIIYLVGTAAPYEMWIWEGEEGQEAWISLGTTEVDLSNYYDKKTIDGKISALTDKDTSQDTEIAKKLNTEDFNTSIGKINEKITTIEGINSSQDTKISALEELTGTHTTNITAINTALDKKAEKTALEALQATVSTNAEAIEALKEADKTFVKTADFTLVKEESAQNKTDIAALNDTINNATTGLVKKVSDLTTAVSNKAESSVVEALKETVGTQGTDIATLKETVKSIPSTEAINSQITAITDPLTARIGTLETFKTDLEPRVKSLETHAVLDSDSITINGGSASTVF